MRILRARPWVLLCCAAFFILSTVSVKAASVYAGTSAGNFGTLDLSTGTFTPIGVPTGFRFWGMGVSGGSLYAADPSSNLYLANKTTGAFSLVGNSNVTDSAIGSLGSTTSGLYSMGYGGELYSVNPSTGGVTPIGSSGLTYAGYWILSTNSSTLYFCDWTSLYTIDTGDGHATLVGAFGGSIQMAALVFQDGKLYGFDTGNHIDTIDTTTGVATVGPSVTGYSIWAMAPLPGPATGAPEPASALLLVGAVGLIVVKRRMSSPGV